MPGIKNPYPKDAAVFEKLYQEEHVPMAVEKLATKTKFVATRVLGSPQGAPPFYRVAEIHFPNREALEACVASKGGQETIAHAIKISTGGPPIMLVSEEEVFTFTQKADA